MFIEFCLFFSLFFMTNETINIWTHILGFLIFFGLFLYSNFVTIPSHQGGYGDHVVFTSYLISYQVSEYELFSCLLYKMFLFRKNPR